MASQMLWDPIRFDETCPSSDGACALVIGNEEIADRRVADGHPVAWIHATALRTEPLAYSGRDQVNPQAGRDAAAALWRDAGITSPIDEIDVAEVYVPFSWFEPMWLENLGFAAEGEGWKLTEAGETAIGGRIPFNASGGVLSSQSHWRVGHDPVRRVGHPGDGQGRRSPGGGRPQGARPRLRRWLAVLLDVGGIGGQAERLMPVTEPGRAGAPGGQAVPRGRDGPRQGGLAGAVRRRRHRRGPDRPVALRPRRQGAPRQGGHREVLRHGDRAEPVGVSISSRPTSAATRRPMSATSSSSRAATGWSPRACSPTG